MLISFCTLSLYPIGVITKGMNGAGGGESKTFFTVSKTAAMFIGYTCIEVRINILIC